MLTNVRLANESFALASGAACGLSAVVSVVLSAPADFAYPQGRFTLCVHNPTDNQSLDIEPRITFTDVEGNEQTVPLGPLFSAPAVISLASGVDAAIPLEGVVGSALVLAILAGVILTSAVSGAASVWRL